MTPDVLERRLEAMDPAAGITARRDPEAILRGILAENPAPSPSVPRARRRRVRIALVAAAAATLVAIPVFKGGESAYAGWTAYPAALSMGEASKVARQCQSWVRISITPSPTEVVLSERRGDIGVALITGPKGLLSTCEQDLSGSGEPSGGTSETYLNRVPEADEIISDGGSGFSDDDDEPIFRIVSGRVGADVTGVIVHTAEQGDVIATVESGYFTAWWPGPPDDQKPGSGGLPMAFTFTAQLRDGTTKNFDRRSTQ